jgi:hypothetical protein
LAAGRRRLWEARAPGGSPGVGTIPTRTPRGPQIRKTENMAASGSLCGELEATCEAQLDAMQVKRPAAAPAARVRTSSCIPRPLSRAVSQPARRRRLAARWPRLAMPVSPQNMRLPSLRKFESSHRRCERAFASRCRGPARASNTERLEKAWARAQRAFAKDYNDRCAETPGSRAVELVCERWRCVLRNETAAAWVPSLV